MLLLSFAARALVCSFLVVAAAVGARRLSNTLSRRSNASGEPTATPSVPVPSETLAEELPHGMFRVLLQHLLLPLALGYGLCLSDRTNMAMAQLQMAGDLGLSQADFGAAASAFFLPYVALQVPANYFLSRVSAKRVLAGYVMCWSSVSAMHSFLHSSGELVVLRLLLGIAEAGYYPGCLYVMARWFPSQVAGQAVALLFSISLVFSSVTLGSSGLIMDSLDGALGVRGWRWLFLIQSLPGIPIALSILAFVDDDPHDCEWLTPSQRRYLVDRFRGEARLGKLADSLIAQLRQLLLLPSTWVLGLQFFSGETPLHQGGLKSMLVPIPMRIGVRFSIADCELRCGAIFALHARS
ncbi:hypothetical protein AB1Y20_010469 [Prymnesium parvum]|uniref:Major facilitator superfamily (MFS) profile domain-containing protein n=1 Tax=Prymnesium parvum TaxID=97485 RepID=A0AB34IRH0_PRYPA